jgi:hypothetical protein
MMANLVANRCGVRARHTVAGTVARQSSLMDGRLMALAMDPEPRQRGSTLESDPEGAWDAPSGGRLKLTVAFTGTTTTALVTGTTKAALVTYGTGTLVADGTGLLGSTDGRTGTGGAGTGARITRASLALAASFFVTVWVRLNHLHVSSSCE